MILVAPDLSVFIKIVILAAREPSVFIKIVILVAPDLSVFVKIVILAAPEPSVFIKIVILEASVPAFSTLHAFLSLFQKGLYAVSRLSDGFSLSPLFLPRT